MECPGYNKQLKFVEGAHRRSQAQCDGKGWSKRNQSINVSPAPNLEPATSTSVVLAPKILRDRVSATTYSPGIYQIQCLPNFIEDVSRSHSIIQDVITFASWFAFIPDRLGTSIALDMAVRCLTVHHLGTTQGNEQAIFYCRLVYGKALYSLQKALYDPLEATLSVTLCATMILCLYEVSCDSVFSLLQLLTLI